MESDLAFTPLGLGLGALGNRILDQVNIQGFSDDFTTRVRL